MPWQSGLHDESALTFDVFNQQRHYIDVLTRESSVRFFRNRQRALDRGDFRTRDSREGAAPLGKRRLGQGTVRDHRADPSPSPAPMAQAANVATDRLQPAGAGSILAPRLRRGRRLRLHRSRTLHQEDRHARKPVGRRSTTTAARSRRCRSSRSPRRASLPPADSPCLEYQMYLFHPGQVEVETILAPTLNFVPGRGLRYAISFDDQPPQIIDALAHNTQRDWERSVKDSVRKVKSTHTLEGIGYHTLEVLDGRSRRRTAEARRQSRRRQAQLSRPARKLSQPVTSPTAMLVFPGGHQEAHRRRSRRRHRQRSHSPRARSPARFWSAA